MRGITMGAASGILAAAFGVAAAELLAAATRPQAGPLTAVGGALIDAAPTPIKEFAVRTFGTHDKPMLLAGIVLVLALLTAVVGVLAVRWRAAGIAGAALLGVVGATAALTRPAATAIDAVPALMGAAISGVVLWVLLRSGSPFTVADSPGTEFDRRAFLRAATLFAGSTAAAAGGVYGVRQVRGNAASSSRSAVRLPAAADPAKPFSGGAGFYTATDTFYRVDTALTIPRINLDTWRLRIHGMVDNEMGFSFAELLDRPLIERDITLNCVSNEVGGPYAGTARWLGVPLAPLLREAGVRAGADQVVARSVEGMTIGTPIDLLLDGRDAMLVVGMNGEPLPLVNGFPVRMLTPGLYGYAGACKWLTELEVTTFDAFDAYWVERGWAARGPVKTASRIDQPKPFAQLAAGAVTVAGVAWAQQRGISKVEINIDGAGWTEAELLPSPSIDTWVQWRYRWSAPSGPHSLSVRATDRTGQVQIADRATPYPDGATGLHTISVTVA
ncbi:DMSO/TMAO reductase YedYZ molybdopterin-dependent catalytic subunit [Actinoplanes lutulentus]|uniref:DMSO/TMAO reductase YedYZ molybdopterin-dependent catalytic subunit n=1 Tax=Actinoplanes lutulentus TaxID=1287878 RepID=A0A327ZB24_9ACTN|nr:molybdopterin-dependent oxidoreductase [Actinoplanes lutulentus]MBB2947154.1 DMSO/TMAO reductase YedYZ molybdopterin-dependent catalytic subunit [Actinoplanes lutulentus]RAK36430.1 DMSO/TMAO reductase YedYZ molybdopterin-dependent catalytic subunit [Actinoplanes lutulentus]